MRRNRPGNGPGDKNRVTKVDGMIEIEKLRVAAIEIFSINAKFCQRFQIFGIKSIDFISVSDV